VAFDKIVSPQRQAYAHALCNFGPNFRWMAFIDLDEFLFPVVQPNLVETLSRYEDCSSLCVPWFMFGFSGHETPPSGLVIENYTRRAPYPPPPDCQLELLKWKSIVDPSSVVGVSNAHIFDLATDANRTVDERRIPISKKTRAEPTPGAILRVNHYYTRSRSEFRAKLATAKFTSAGTTHKAHTGPLKRQAVADIIERETVQDKVILRFAPALRERLSAQ
jgi:Glycosyltransferase family 92